MKLRNIYFDLLGKWLIKQPHVNDVYLWVPRRQLESIPSLSKYIIKAAKTRIMSLRDQIRSTAPITY